MVSQVVSGGDPDSQEQNLESIGVWYFVINMLLHCWISSVVVLTIYSKGAVTAMAQIVNVLDVRCCSDDGVRVQYEFLLLPFSEL